MVNFSAILDKGFVHQLTKNFSYLFLVKIFNLGSKYLIIAYLLKTLGAINYGTYTWIDSIVQFFLLVTNYGFNTYLAKNVIESNNKDKTKIHKLISNIFQLKFGLFALSFISLFVITLFYDQFHDYKFLLYLYMFLIIGEVFFPIWYFQGIQKFKNITISIFILRLMQLIAIVTFVNQKEDISILLWILVITNAIYGAMGVYLLKKDLPNFQFKFQKWVYQKKYLKEGFMFFLGIMGTFFFNYLTIYLIGIYFGSAKVTQFDIAFKIIFLFIIPFEIFHQALFPIIVKNKDIMQLRVVGMFALVVSLIFTLFAYFNTGLLLSIFGVHDIEQYAQTVHSMIYLIPIVAISFVLGNTILIPFGYYKEFNSSLIYSSLIYFVFIISLFFLNQFTFENLIIGRVLADVMLMIIRIYFVHNRKVLVLK